MQTSEFEKKNLDVNTIKALIDKKTGNTLVKGEKKTKIVKLPLRQEDIIKAQFLSCWSVPAGIPLNDDDFRVSVKLELSKDGHVKSFVQSITRAIQLCSPIKILPSVSYEKWKVFVLRFDIKDMYSG